MPGGTDSTAPRPTPAAPTTWVRRAAVQAEGFLKPQLALEGRAWHLGVQLGSSWGQHAGRSGLRHPSRSGQRPGDRAACAAAAAAKAQVAAAPSCALRAAFVRSSSSLASPARRLHRSEVADLPTLHTPGSAVCAQHGARPMRTPDLEAAELPRTGPGGHMPLIPVRALHGHWPFLEAPLLCLARGQKLPSPRGDPAASDLPSSEHPPPRLSALARCHPAEPVSFTPGSANAATSRSQGTSLGCLKEGAAPSG